MLQVLSWDRERLAPVLVCVRHSVMVATDKGAKVSITWVPSGARWDPDQTTARLAWRYPVIRDSNPSTASDAAWIALRTTHVRTLYPVRGLGFGDAPLTLC
jgi:hypothetical protein